MDKQFAFSTLTIKAVNEEKREFTGIASTVEPDRVNDVMVPGGAKFKLPLPFLYQHDHSQPIGEITEVKVTDKGIEVKGKVKQVSAPSRLAARLDEAWVSMREGLVRGLSIGFRPIKYAFLDNGGIEYEEWDWMELSAVVIPANAGSGITAIKSFDAEVRASMGAKGESVKEPSEVTENKKKTVKISKTKEKEMSIGEKLKGFKDERSKKAKKLEEMMEKSMDSGETFDEAEQEEYDTLETEVKALDGHIEKAERLLAQKAASATPVTEEDGLDETKAKSVRQGVAVVQRKENLEKGIGFARIARCKALSKMDSAPAYDIARNLYGEDSQVYGVLKTAVAAGTTADSTWAAPLVGDETTVFADFVEFLRPMTILGRMGQNGIPGPTRIPFRTRLITQTTGGEGYWVGEGNAKPVTKFDFTGTTLEPLKVANLAVVTMELLRDSSPSAEALLRQQLAEALAARLDTDFLDPGKFPVANVSPASISFGVVPITSTGTDADAVRCDLEALLQSYAAANNAPTTGVIVMSANKAIALMGMRNALGQREFPDINMGGGTLEGFPVITSQYLSGFGDSTGEFVFMVNASDIYLGDEGGVSVDMSDQASVEMDNAPANPTVAATVMVSLWQRNLVGFRAERTINWAKRRDSAVAVLEEVNWTACVTSV